MSRDLLPLLYTLRLPIVGFLVQWPLWGWAFQTPLMRGLADVGNAQVGMVSQLAAIQSIYLAVIANVVLLWGRVRLDGERGPVAQRPRYRLIVRRGFSVASLVFWAAFMSAVRTRSSASYFWLAAFANLLVIASAVVLLEEMGQILARRPSRYRFFLLPLPGLWSDSFPWARRLRPRLAGLAPRTPRTLWRARRFAVHHLDRILGPGFMDYRGQRPRGLLPGHLLMLSVTFLILWTHEDFGRQFLESGSFVYRHRVIAPSTLSMVLSGTLVLTSVLAFLAFWADRYRLPVSLLVLGWFTVCSSVAGSDHVFWSAPVKQDQLDAALTPAQVLGLAPSALVAVAAAGGGIQASAWTGQVLSGLQEELGADFKRAVRVMSGVSGGAVGLVFYLGTYDGVWGAAYSPAEARTRAMGSFLDAVAWGLVYPDLHSLLVPIPWFRWRDADRGWALERLLAQRSGRYPGPTLLSLAPSVRTGLPVVLLNATLTAEALPVVFTNSRFPGPDLDGPGRRGIRSFHEDFRLETRLETAARMSATFPLISPASRPSELKGKDAFVDGGYFDNSGLYSLMGWLEQAVVGLPPSSRPREVLLLQIDAFPEAQALARQRAAFAWYRQLMIPFETVVGVRETGQAARNRYDFPLLAKSLEGRLNVRVVEFRFKPSPRCDLERPPLSWHLSEMERGCVVEGWTSPKILEARRAVGAWLKARDRD